MRPVVPAGKSARRGRGEGWANEAELVFGNDIHLDFQRLLAGRQHHAVDRGDVGVVAPYGERDVIVLYQGRIGGVEADPTPFLSAL
jgi:hypothetical protein